LEIKINKPLQVHGVPDINVIVIMRKRKYVSLDEDCPLGFVQETGINSSPVPQCHNIVSTSQILTSQKCINLQRLADLFPFTTYDRKRFAAITIRLANPHCTCLLFGSGKLVITGSTSFSACIVASHEVTKILREASPRDWFEVGTCVIQNIVAHVELPKGSYIDLDKLYSAFCECSTYQRSIFPGLVLRPPQSPIVLLIFTSGRIVCTGGRSYDDIYYGFKSMFEKLRSYIQMGPTLPSSNLTQVEGFCADAGVEV